MNEFVEESFRAVGGAGDWTILRYFPKPCPIVETTRGGTTVSDDLFRVIPFDGRFAREIGEMIVGIQAGEFGVPITLADQPDLSDIPGFYGTGRGGFWIARADESVIGTIGLRDFGAGHGALRKMFVAKDHRGSTRGVAAALMSTLIDHARVSGMNTVWLGTTDRYLAAHRFYEKNGFVRVTTGDLPPSFPRMAVDNVFYRRMI